MVKETESDPTEAWCCIKYHSNRWVFSM